MDEIEGYLLYAYISDVWLRVSELRSQIKGLINEERERNLTDIEFDLNRLSRRLNIKFGREG